ncbi:SpoIIE family protein phosphatase [Streptomyces krungchingensis]|uniref:ATP-binding SpoIIE family protein phosphatase n=1 Tax=Streptomyces krungchingensis TaxID=1565034 RepID=UPI003CE8922A
MHGFSPGAEEHVFAFAGIATAVLDDRGTVVRWSDAAAELLGRTAEEVCGHPVRALLTHECPGAASDAGMPAAGRALLRHRSGASIDVTFRVLRTQPAAESLVLVAPTQQVTHWEQGASVLRALLSQDRVGIGMHDVDLSVVWTNISSEMFDGAALSRGGRLRDVMSVADAEAVEAALRHVLDTGEPLIRKSLRMRSRQDPERTLALSLSAFRVEDAQKAPAGVVTMVTDAPDQQRARHRLDVLHEAADRIGRSLDVTRTAQDLMDVLVPGFGDVGWVELADAVIDGDEPPKTIGGGDLQLRRAAMASVHASDAAALLQPGETVPRLPFTLELGEVQQGRPVLLDPEKVTVVLGDPTHQRLFLPARGHSGIWAPLFARGLILGAVTVWRTEQQDPFEQDDADLMAEVASRAALSVDNARRYTREHRVALTLQRRLLPSATTDTAAAETTGVYLPAGGGAGISGDWYDVIPLPSFRVALVVGDVVGHGLNAAAAMGGLRTAVRTLADLELDPTELLTHLDDLVQRISDDTDAESLVGATCLYVVYDPVTRRCAVAGAGHPPPVVIGPDGTTKVVPVRPGPPLGVGGMPFECVSVELEPGSILALYTDGLIEQDDGDVDAGLRWLTENLAAAYAPDRPLDDMGRAVLAGLGDAPPRDDIALLLARTRAVPERSSASWEFAADPAVVAEARQAATRQLAAWGLDEAAFATELIVSELVTNAVRYAGGPIGLRLIRDDVLVCEVTDPSNTQPRLRRARWTDEGGRGLFLVAQLSTRWGSRYGRNGKTIWVEQSLVPDTIDVAALM